VRLDKTENNVTIQLDITCSTLNPHPNAENPPNGTSSTTLTVRLWEGSGGNVSVVSPFTLNKKDIEFCDGLPFKKIGSHMSEFLFAGT